MLWKQLAIIRPLGRRAQAAATDLAKTLGLVPVLILAGFALDLESRWLLEVIIAETATRYYRAL